jgi:hypothetical protein
MNFHNPLPALSTLSFPLPLLLLLLVFIPSCSSYPPDELFTDDIHRMVMIEREMGFSEEIDEVRIVSRSRFKDRAEIEVRLTGRAAHPDLTIGAVLPATKALKHSWSRWKYFCRKTDGKWVIEEKYKVEEGFE